MGYIQAIGQQHLQDNVYYTGKMYNELDVMNFNRQQFLRNLGKNDLDDSFIQHNLQRKESRENFEKVLYKTEKREIDHEFTKLCIARLDGVMNLNEIKELYQNKEGDGTQSPMMAARPSAVTFQQSSMHNITPGKSPDGDGLFQI